MCVRIEGVERAQGVNTMGGRRPVMGTVVSLERFSLHNGPGIRSTLFVKGCPLRCLWCANPESQAFEPELSYSRELCMTECDECVRHCASGLARKGADGRVDLCWSARPVGAEAIAECVKVCPSGALAIAGRTISAVAAARELLADRPYFAESGGGVTISGGEPLAQADFCCEVLRQVRQAGVHTALDTAGFADRTELAKVAAVADLVLFDLKTAEENANRRWTGQPLGIIVDNLRWLLQVRAETVRVRVPLIPSLNGTEEHVAVMAALLRSMAVNEIDLLPYHRLGATKYPRIGMTCPLPDEVTPNPTVLTTTVERYAAGGITAHVVA